MPMGSQYQQISNQNTTPSQRPYIPTNGGPCVCCGTCGLGCGGGIK
jgi:hypothetical protein